MGNILQFQQIQTIKDGAAEKQQDKFTSEQIMAMFNVIKIINSKTDDFQRSLFLTILREIRQEPIRVSQLQTNLKYSILQRVFIYWKAECRKFRNKNIVSNYQQQIFQKKQQLQEKRLQIKIQKFMEKDNQHQPIHQENMTNINTQENALQVKNEINAEIRTELKPSSGLIQQDEKQFLQEKQPQTQQESPQQKKMTPQQTSEKLSSKKSATLIKQKDSQQQKIVQQQQYKQYNNLKTTSVTYHSKGSTTNVAVQKQKSPVRQTVISSISSKKALNLNEQNQNCKKNDSSFVKSVSPNRNFHSDQKVQNKSFVLLEKLKPQLQQQLDKIYQLQQNRSQQEMLQQQCKDKQQQLEQQQKNNQKQYSSLQQQLTSNAYSANQIKTFDAVDKRIKTEQGEGERGKEQQKQKQRIGSPEIKPLKSPPQILSKVKR